MRGEGTSRPGAGRGAGKRSPEKASAQYRICFRWEMGDAEDVEIADYH